MRVWEGNADVRRRNKDIIYNENEKKKMVGRERSRMT
jgi:hypothetical protein